MIDHDSATSLPTIEPPSTNHTPTTPLPVSSSTPERFQQFSIGHSVEGRAIHVWRFGVGSVHIVLVGGIHGGYEANSSALAELLVEHFEANPDDVLPGTRIDIIPSANPDGLAAGTGLTARFNANEVDLNRNWACGWSPTAYLRDIEVFPGDYPFSEPETQALQSYFLTEVPDAVVFYHSQLGAVFTGTCGQRESATWLGEVLSDATGYAYEPSFEYYEVSGDATNWLNIYDIPAATVELQTRESPEFERNLAGVIALQCALIHRNPPPHIPADVMDKAVERICPAQPGE